MHTAHDAQSVCGGSAQERARSEHALAQMEAELAAALDDAAAIRCGSRASALLAAVCSAWLGRSLLPRCMRRRS
jgi:hypothetical protein